MEYAALGLVCVFIGYLIGRIQVQFKYERFLIAKGSRRNG